jgi:hypothetical protein
MAAVSEEGEPASKVIMYRDFAESICDKCKDDQGSYMRVVTQFIHWTEPAPDAAIQRQIKSKVFGTAPGAPH